jgi:hypothetical protein
MLVSAILWVLLGSIVLLGIYVIYDEKIGIKKDKTNL